MTLSKCRSARRAWLVLLAGLPLAGPAVAAKAKPAVAALQGVVTQVIDGGSVRFTPAGQAAITVRLRDIDPPEPCQPGAAEAKAGLAALALNKTATLQAGGHDAQGRTVGVLIADDANIAKRMVEEGYAWSARGRNDHGPFIKQERMAKALGRGVHATAGAVLPRDWRRTRPCAAAAG